MVASIDVWARSQVYLICLFKTLSSVCFELNGESRSCRMQIRRLCWLVKIVNNSFLSFVCTTSSISNHIRNCWCLTRRCQFEYWKDFVRNIFNKAETIDLKIELMSMETRIRFRFDCIRVKNTQEPENPRMVGLKWRNVVFHQNL